MYKKNSLCKDKRFQAILIANILSSIGSGITMIAIPLLLVMQPNGNKLFGVVMLAMTVFSFLITPSIGYVIDKFSRKKLLLIGEFTGFLTIFLFALSGFFSDYATWHYVALYGIGSLYYTFFYPTIFAFNQEVFDSKVLHSLNGMMEIQGQLSSMIAGAAASIMLTKWDIQWILVFDCFTYIVAFYFFSKVEYVKTKSLSNEHKPKIAEGYHFINQNKRLSIFLFLSLMPFISVMLTNYLFPIYLIEQLKASSEAYGIQNMFYGFGALLAGVFVPVFIQKMGNEQVILFTVSAFAIGMSFIIYMKWLPLYFLFICFLAFMNAATRVARNTFIMEHIPNELVGRVDSIFRLVSLAVRIVLTVWFTYLASSNDIKNAFLVLDILLILSAVGIFISYKNQYKKQLLRFRRIS
ncbi:MFS transporter [Priestia megaterium]|nr:MFS transporter [Priestia megaterium]